MRRAEREDNVSREASENGQDGDIPRVSVSVFWYNSDSS